jgi:hypothetical protein
MTTLKYSPVDALTGILIVAGVVISLMSTL